MSAEIVVGACYRDPESEMVMRVTAHADGVVSWVAVQDRGTRLPVNVSERCWNAYRAVRIADADAVPVPNPIVGACYRDVRDGEIVRVTDASDPLAPKCVVVRESHHRYDDGSVGYETFREWPRDRWERVSDPTPAVIDDAEPLLGGELNAWQFFTWAATQDADRAPRVHISCTGGVWTATLTVCPPGQDRVTQRSASARDPQDALTALMSEAS